MTYLSDDSATPLTDRIREVCDNEGFTYHRVDQGCFKGGFFLHRSLPYKSDDIFFADGEKDIIVLLSGAIYNRNDLTCEADITGVITDAELAGRLFLLEGPGFVHRLNGDFAIFIHSPSQRETYLFRDHIGIRPMAFTIAGGTLFFSSDIIGLSRVFTGSKPVVTDYLLGHFKYIDYSKTPAESVKKLLPGHYLRFSEKGSGMVKYWDPEKIVTDRKMSYDAMLSDLKTIVNDAVRIRCDSRFVAGAHVSSGIDSGMVSALARREYQHQDEFRGFSWSPGDFTPQEVKYDEREIVIKSCQKTGITPVFSDLDKESFPRYVSASYSNQGYFYEDKSADQAVAYGINLLFSGWGGDEFISTGDRGIETDLLLGLKWRTFFRRNPVTKPKAFVRYFFFYIINPALGILDRSTARSFRNEARYILKKYKRSDRNALRNFYFHTSRHQLHLRLLRFYHLQERCESWMVNGYRKGLEYRYPLLDKRIIEYMLRVPSVLLCKTDHFRPLLREISEGIMPDEVRWQWYKNDPVHWSFVDILYMEAAEQFMTEVKEWRKNPDLYFVDFDLLENDIIKYREEPATVDSETLFRGLIFLKAAYEFISEFRKQDA